MKSRTMIILSAIGLIFLIVSLNAFAEDKKAPSEQEMMAVYMKYATPGANHKMLEPLMGTWNVTTKFWQAASTVADTSTGTSESKWILSGRYATEEVTSMMSGMPFHGMGIFGYDNYKQKYVSFWIDEMSTSFMLSSGTADSAGKVITMTGTYDDVASGQKDKPFKTIMKILNVDKHVFEMYETGADGKDFKSFEATYTRKK